MCAKCKLQLGKHLPDHQVQNNAEGIDTSENCTINCQCNHYKSEASENLNDTHKFNNIISTDLIKILQTLSASVKNVKPEHSFKNEGDADVQDLIKVDNEIFLIEEGLREPLLTIANKLLGRQNLKFNQLTPPEQQLWNLFEKSEIY
jgi:hypothetical protein